MKIELFGDKAKDAEEGQLYRVTKTFSREGRPVAALELDLESMLILEALR